MNVGHFRTLAALAAAFFLAAGGCGGGDEGDLGSGADVAPASAALFISMDTDFEGGQWRTAERLLEKFPGGREAAQEILREIEEDDVDFERDVKPALGPETDVVVLDLEGEAAVLLTQPPDEAKFRELVRKGDEPSVLEEIDGWTAVARTQEILDRFKKARADQSLADDDAFDEAMQKLPEEAIAKVFLNGRAVSDQLRSDPDVTPNERAAFDCFLSGEGVPSFAFALAAEDDGARVSGAYRADAEDGVEGYEAELARELPAGALLYASFRNLADRTRDFLRCAGESDDGFDRQLAQVELALGVSIEEDILPLLEDEGAIAVYEPAGSRLAQNTGGPEIPTASLVAKVKDEADALSVADRIARRAGAFVDGLEVEDVDVDGVSAKRVSIAGQGALFYAAFDGMLVVTSTEEGISGLQGDGPRLSDDEVYTGAREAAGAPGETTGFAYANIHDAVGYFFSFFEPAGADVPEDARENLEPLRSVFFWGETDGDTHTFEGFVEIE